MSGCSRARSLPLRRLISRAVVAGAAVQAAVIGALLIGDAWRRRGLQESAVRRHPPEATTVGDGSITVFSYGEDLYAEMLAAIDGASHTILLESFIWKGDAVGRRFKERLIAAARRGVRVHVVYDGFANLVVPRVFFAFPDEVHVGRFPVLRWGALWLDLRKTGRDHRKILVVDDEVGFVGGYNIGGLYATQWRDTHLRVTGPAVWDLRRAFVDTWNAINGSAGPRLEHHGSTRWDPHVRTARNSPAQLVFPIRGLYLDAIHRSTRHVLITQAYFIPDRAMVAALLTAAGRGVDVQVIVPEVSNHVIADWLSRGSYAALLRGGVRIWRYRGAMVHAKTATVDGQWSTVGTANIDRLSLSGNYEINLEVHDAGLAAIMERIHRHDRESCRELTLEEWERRSTVARLTELVLAPLRPLL